MPITVVVPAFRAEATLGACLEALATAGFGPGEIVVVDDGSPDGTAAVARAGGVRVVTTGGRQGAARARNAGVAATAEASAEPDDVLFFVDADVAVHGDVRGRLEAFFAANPGHAGIFGSYDDAPPGPPISRLRNLLHHHVHQRAGGEATTFWTGIGALRRADFAAAGGFRREDEVEDVALGLRLAARERRIRLDPALQGTHLKRWTWRGFFWTDYRWRAIPWTRMLLDPGNRERAAVLNAGTRGKAGVLAVAASLLALPLAALAPVAGLLLLLAALAALLGLERDFLHLAAAKGGAGLALRGAAMLWLHYLAAGLGYARVRFLG